MIATIQEFKPNRDQLHAMEALYYHCHHVSHNGAKRAFGFHSEQCDGLRIPFWVQNNLAAMGDNRQIYYKNGVSRIVGAACQLDWRPSVSR